MINFQVRSARPTIVLNGQDYYDALAPYFLNLAYTDNCDGAKADDLHLQLADRDGKFISSWMPDLGTFLDVSIVAERWFSPNAAALSLDCGRFWIDTVDFELPQHTVTIKGNSIPSTAYLKNINETRGFEKSNLRDIAQQIAGENQMELDYEADVNPQYTRVEQQEESALQFLVKRAGDAKLAIKVHRNKIIIYDELKLEQAAPQFTVISGQNMGAVSGLGSFGAFSELSVGSVGAATYRIAAAHFTLNLVDVRAGHKVAHSSVATGKTTTADFSTDEQGVATWHNNVNEGTDDQDEDESEGDGGELRTDGVPLDWQNTQAGGGASLKAKAETRRSNKDKFHADIELGLGNPLVAAGMTFMMQGFGKWDGKWFVESAEHTVAPAYTTKLKARMCLADY